MHKCLLFSKYIFEFMYNGYWNILLLLKCYLTQKSSGTTVLSDIKWRDNTCVFSSLQAPVSLRIGKFLFQRHCIWFGRQMQEFFAKLKWVEAGNDKDRWNLKASLQLFIWYKKRLCFRDFFTKVLWEIGILLRDFFENSYQNGEIKHWF